MDHQEAFIPCLEAFGPRHNRYQVMADCALLGVAALHNAVAFSHELEIDYPDAYRTFRYWGNNRAV